MLGHKGSLGKFKKTEIVSSIFSNHNIMRLGINYKKKTAENTKMWRLNNMLLNNQRITMEIKEETKKYPEGTSLVVQWLRICLPMQGTWVRSLVGELRSHMLRGN